MSSIYEEMAAFFFGKLTMIKKILVELNYQEKLNLFNFVMDKKYNIAVGE